MSLNSSNSAFLSWATAQARLTEINAEKERADDEVKVVTLSPIVVASNVRGNIQYWSRNLGYALIYDLSEKIAVKMNDHKLAMNSTHAVAHCTELHVPEHVRKAIGLVEVAQQDVLVDIVWNPMRFVTGDATLQDPQASFQCANVRRCDENGKLIGDGSLNVSMPAWWSPPK